MDEKQKFAETEFDLKISDDKSINDEKMQDFIDIYKNKFGMPASEGNETYIKDYLFKLIEFKNNES